MKEDLSRVANERIASNNQKILSHLSSSEVISEKALEINVVDTKDRQYASYIGGCIVASNDNFLMGSVSKQQYDEYGSSIMIKQSLIRT